MDPKINNKGQITMYAIIALFFVAIILVIFAFYRGPSLTTSQDFDNPENFVDNCIRESLRDSLELMVPQGGLVNPTDFKVYNDIKVNYLCKNVNYYEPCIHQYPLFMSTLEDELEKEMQDDMEQCFVTLEDGLKTRGYEYSGGEFTLDVTLKPKVVEATINKELSITKNEVSRQFTSFTTELNVPLYDLGSIAQEIASQEAKFCYFEYVGYNVLYKDFEITKTVTSDSTKIYSIRHKETNEIMNIAIRGCAVPAGF